MKRELLAVLFQQTGFFLSELIKNRGSSKRDNTPQYILSSEPPSEVEKTPVAAEENKATSIATGCVPCSIGHMGTCTGVLNESIRFARSEEGLASPEVIERVSICLSELNAMERVDLRPEMILDLPPHEKGLAEKALEVSRATRHKLEGLSTLRDLEEAAATMQKSSNEISKEFFRNKLSKMPKEEKLKLAEQAIEKLEEGK